MRTGRGMGSERREKRTRREIQSVREGRGMGRERRERERKEKRERDVCGCNCLTTESGAISPRSARSS